MAMYSDTCTSSPLCSPICRSQQIIEQREDIRFFNSHDFLTNHLLSSAKDQSQAQAWDCIAAIKSNILKRWDTAAKGIQVCCIKFVQRVVQVQTPGMLADPRVCSYFSNLPFSLDTNATTEAGNQERDIYRDCTIRAFDNETQYSRS